MITKAWRSKIIAIGITIGVLFSLATYTVTPVIGQEQELGYDDGSPEFGFVAGPSVAGAVKFTVPSTMQILRLKFHVWGEMKTVRVHVLDANFNSIFSKEVIPSTGWFEVDVSSNNVFVQGDFHVAWQWISESPNGPWLDVDTTPPHHQRSYLGVPGSSPIPAQPNEDYMIRVVVREAGQQEVKFRGVVIGFPDFGGAVGVGGVNIRINEVLLDPTSNLEIGDVATVTWPMVPPFAYIQVEIGDRVEVYGYYNTQGMPDWWSGIGEHWVSLSTSDHYLEKVEEKPRVKFRGTVACDEDEWYNPSKPYGNYFVDVVVDEIIDDPYGKLVQGGLYCVAYQESHGFSEGDCVEVYGTYIEGTIVVGGAYGSPGDYIKECQTETWSFAIITDLHIGDGDSDDDYGDPTWNDDASGQDGLHSTEFLRQVVNLINSNRSKYNIAFVVVTGDLSDSAELSELHKAKEILNDLEVPWIPIIGNHDVWPYYGPQFEDNPSAKMAPEEESDKFFNGYL